MSAFDVLAICLRRRENKEWCIAFEEVSIKCVALLKKVARVPLDKLACLRVPGRFL